MADGRSKSPCGRKSKPKYKGRPPGSKNKIQKLTELDLKLKDNLLHNPMFSNMTISQRVEYLGCSVPSYYKSLKKPLLQEELKQALFLLVVGKSKSVIEACVNYAINEKKNSKDRAILLQMLGLYKPKTDTEVTINQESKNMFEGLTLEELKALAKLNMGE